MSQAVLVSYLCNSDSYINTCSHGKPQPGVVGRIHIVLIWKQVITRICPRELLEVQTFQEKYNSHNLEQNIRLPDSLDFIPLVGNEVCTPDANCRCLRSLLGVAGRLGRFWSLPVDEENVHVAL